MSKFLKMTKCKIVWKLVKKIVAHSTDKSETNKTATTEFRHPNSNDNGGCTKNYNYIADGMMNKQSLNNISEVHDAGLNDTNKLLDEQHECGWYDKKTFFPNTGSNRVLKKTLNNKHTLTIFSNLNANAVEFKPGIKSGEFASKMRSSKPEYKSTVAKDNLKRTEIVIQFRQNLEKKKHEKIKEKIKISKTPEGDMYVKKLGNNNEENVNDFFLCN
eukprot:UN28659